MLRGICFYYEGQVMLCLPKKEEKEFIAPNRTVHKRLKLLQKSAKKFLDF